MYYWCNLNFFGYKVSNIKSIQIQVFEANKQPAKDFSIDIIYV
jgi:hypothetical protein